MDGEDRDVVPGEKLFSTGCKIPGWPVAITLGGVLLLFGEALLSVFVPDEGGPWEDSIFFCRLPVLPSTF